MIERCKQCGRANGSHKMDCSERYRCKECDSLYGHKMSCNAWRHDWRRRWNDQRD